MENGTVTESDEPPDISRVGPISSDSELCSPAAAGMSRPGVEASDTDAASPVTLHNTSGSFGYPKLLVEHLPPGIALRPAAHGLGVFATRAFRAGTVLYRGRWRDVPDAPANTVVKIPMVVHKADADVLAEGGASSEQHELDLHVHSVAAGHGVRQLYGFDAYMNHSCDPTTYSANETTHEGGGEYDTVAVRDIAPGEEVTCDYNLFEWDCEDKGISTCLCGARTCRGSALGFAHLPRATQLELLPRAYGPVAAEFYARHPDVHLVSYAPFHPSAAAFPHTAAQLPPTVQIRAVAPPRDAGEAGTGASVAGEGGAGEATHVLVAARAVAAGEEVFRNVTRVLPLRATVVVAFAEGATGVMHTRVLVPLRHSVDRGGGGRHYFGFDSFSDHSCDPNTATIFDPEPPGGGSGGGSAYRVVALRDIACGEAITCDYATFDLGLDGVESPCACASPKCRGVVMA